MPSLAQFPLELLILLAMDGLPDEYRHHPQVSDSQHGIAIFSRTYIGQRVRCQGILVCQRNILSYTLAARQSDTYYGYLNDTCGLVLSQSCFHPGACPECQDFEHELSLGPAVA